MMEEKPMRRVLRVAAVFILAACGCGSDPIQFGPGTNGSVRGTVTDTTGAAVANAAVALTRNAQADRITNSDADGVYAFANNWLREMIGLDALK